MLIRRIEKETAQRFFQQYEHLGNCGLGVWHYGIYSEDNLIAVVSFGTVCFNPHRSSIGAIAAKYNLRVIQLTRGGTKFDQPKNTPSMSVSMALKQIRNDLGDMIVIAYSDIKWNEVGTIYQASNFSYLGMTNPKGQSNYFINGLPLSGWNVRKQYGTRKVESLLNLGLLVEKKPLSQKHMYVYLNMCKTKKISIHKEIATRLKPFPKRKDIGVGSMHEIWAARNIDLKNYEGARPNQSVIPSPHP
ncbi:MAG: hypothetical protein ABFC56_10995 [Clostridiaceae bacterium]